MITVYTDGSNVANEKSGYGVVILDEQENIIAELSGLAPEEYNDSRNVNGEIHGAIAAMEWCKNKGIKEVRILHDYIGLSKWYYGEWKRNKELTKMYRDFMMSFQSSIRIEFEHVKGHSGDKWNDRADALARQSLGLEER